MPITRRRGRFQSPGRSGLTRRASGSLVSYLGSTELSMYISYSKQAEGIQAYRDNKRLITSVCPSWYAPVADGTIQLQEPGVTTEDLSFVAEVKANGAKPIAVLANYYGPSTAWTWTPVHTILGSSGLRTTHVAAIVSLCQTKGFAGVDIDYEHGNDATDRDKFTLFMQELCTAMHAVGLTVSTCVVPKTADPGSNLAGQIQNWSALGLVCDQVRVMIYDLDPATEGNQSPLPNWKQYAYFAASQMPAAKVILGAADYGYRYLANALEPPGDGTITYDGAETLRLANGSPTPTFDATNASWNFSYGSGPTLNEFYMENAQTLAAKAAVTHSQGFKGNHVWRGGGEDDTSYQAMINALTATGTFTAIVNPTDDTYMDANVPTKDSGTLTNMFVKGSVERRTLMRFRTDLLVGKTITAATLSLYKVQWLGTDPGPAGRTYRLQRLLATGWKEGDGLTPSLDGTTWNLRDAATTTAWGTAGAKGAADVTTTDQFDTAVPTGNAVWMDFTGASMLAMVNWARANGDRLDLVLSETTLSGNHQSEFASRQHATALLRPQLKLTYTL